MLPVRSRFCIIAAARINYYLNDLQSSFLLKIYNSLKLNKSGLTRLSGESWLVRDTKTLLLR